MVQLLILLLATGAITFFVTAVLSSMSFFGLLGKNSNIVDQNENNDELYDNADELYGKDYSQQKNHNNAVYNKNKKVFFNSEIETMAKNDAHAGEINIVEGMEKQLDNYKKIYKEERQKIIERKALSDASQSHKFDHHMISFQPVLQGSGLTIPAEIALYQELFLKEKIRLEDVWMKKNNVNPKYGRKFRKKLANTDEVNEVLEKLSSEKVLKEIYEDDNNNPVDMETFYKEF